MTSGDAVVALFNQNIRFLFLKGKDTLNYRDLEIFIRITIFYTYYDRDPFKANTFLDNNKNVITKVFKNTLVDMQI